SGLVDVAVACGVETMTRIPMGSNVPAEPDFGQPRGGRYPDFYEPTTQFEGAERIAENWAIDRAEIDGFGFRSQQLAARAWEKELRVGMDKVNPNGGAIALGHPLGATGVVLLTKALNELERTGGRYGLVSMCCGGGLGTGTILERL